MLTSSQLLRKFTTGRKYINLRKAGVHGKTKTAFVDSLMSDAATHTAIQSIIDDNNITKGTDLNNPEINGRMVQILRGRSNGVVAVSPVDTGTFKAKPKKTTTKKPTVISPIDADKETTPSDGGKPDLEFLKPILAHELKRFKNHGDTPAFNDWSNEPHQRAVEKQFVAGLEDKYHNARFADLNVSGGADKMILATGVLADMIFLQTGAAAALGISPINKRLTTAQKAKLEKSAEMREVNDVLAHLNTADLYKAQRNKALQEQQVNIQEGKLSTDLTKGLGMPDSTIGPVQDIYNEAIQSAYKKLVHEGHSPFDKSTMANSQMIAYEEVFKALQNMTPNTRNNVPPSMIDVVNIGITSNTDPYRTGLEYEDVYKKMVDDARNQIDPSAVNPDDGTAKAKTPEVIAKPAEGGGGGDKKLPGNGGSSIGDVTKTVTGDDKDGGKQKTRGKPDSSPPGGGVTTEPIDKPSNKPKKDKKKPDPPTEPKERDKRKKRDDDSDDDESDDEDDKPIPAKPPFKPNPDKEKPSSAIRAQLRPYFNIGGENMLRISDKEQKREMRDWELYDFVPGQTYESETNPLTIHNFNQRRFRYQNTKQQPAYYKPARYEGARRNEMMQDVYKRDQQFYDQHNPEQYIGRSTMSNQARMSANPSIDMRTRPHNHPDLLQAASRDVLKIRRMKHSAILLASKRF